MIFIFLLLFLGQFVTQILSVMSLQLPGLSFGTGEPTTVEIEFLDADDNVQYLIKGEVFSQSLPMRADNSFFPDSLTGTQKFISKLRIKAAESGLTLKVFETATSTVPKLLVLMKSGFIMANNQPIDIDFASGDDHQTTSEAEINWFNRDLNEMARTRGIHIGKVELHVERHINAPLVSVKTFGPIGVDTSNNPVQAMNSVVNGASAIPSSNVAVLPASPNQHNLPMVLLNPPGTQIQYPNAPPFAY